MRRNAASQLLCRFASHVKHENKLVVLHIKHSQYILDEEDKFQEKKKVISESFVKGKRCPNCIHLCLITHSSSWFPVDFSRSSTSYIKKFTFSHKLVVVWFGNWQGVRVCPKFIHNSISRLRIISFR